LVKLGTSRADSLASWGKLCKLQHELTDLYKQIKLEADEVRPLPPHALTRRQPREHSKRVEEQLPKLLSKLVKQREKCKFSFTAFEVGHFPQLRSHSPSQLHRTASTEAQERYQARVRIVLHTLQQIESDRLLLLQKTGRRLHALGVH
jgi:hypothetical protein